MDLDSVEGPLQKLMGMTAIGGLVCVCMDGGWKIKLELYNGAYYLNAGLGFANTLSIGTRARVSRTKCDGRVDCILVEVGNHGGPDGINVHSVAIIPDDGTVLSVQEHIQC